MTWAIIAFLYVSGATGMSAVIADDGVASLHTGRAFAVVAFWPLAIWAFAVMAVVELRK